MTIADTEVLSDSLAGKREHEVVERWLRRGVLRTAADSASREARCSPVNTGARAAFRVL